MQLYMDFREIETYIYGSVNNRHICRGGIYVKVSQDMTLQQVEEAILNNEEIKKLLEGNAPYRISYSRNRIEVQV